MRALAAAVIIFISVSCFCIYTEIYTSDGVKKMNSEIEKIKVFMNSKEEAKAADCFFKLKDDWEHYEKYFQLMTEHNELDKINDLLESLFILTDMTIALYDENFDFVESYPLYSRKSWFCAYIEHYPEFKNLCKKCDIKHFNIAKKTKKPIIYECHAGLLDIVFPLVQNNIVIGYITMGQVSANPDMDYIKNICVHIFQP